MSDEVHSAPADQQESKTPAHLHPLSAAYSAVARAWTWLRSQGPPLLSRGTKFIVHNFNTLVVKLPGAIIVVFILWMVIRGLTEHVTVIEPLSVPKQLEDRGYTPEVAGKHMRDAIEKFASAVNTTMKNPEIALQGELPNIVVPTVGISLDAIVASIRTMLRSTRSRSITGEFTSLGNQLWLRLRLDGHQIYTSPAGDLEKPDELLAGAAPEILKIIQPYFAAAAMRNGNPTGALALADAVIQHRPESDENVPWLYNLKGSILYDSGDYLAARSAAEKALALDPGLAGAHLNLGVLSGAEGDHQSAMSEYAKAVRTNPEIPAGHNDVAVELNNKGDVDGAIREYQNAIKLEPNFALAHHNLGNVMRSLKKDREAASEYAEALDQYRRHLNTNPKDAATHLGLAAVLRAQGDAAGATAQLQAAVARFTDIVQSEPKNLVARRYLGDALEGLQKYDDAAAAYQEALEIKPDAVAVRAPRRYRWPRNTTRRPRSIARSSRPSQNTPPLTTSLALCSARPANTMTLSRSTARPSRSIRVLRRTTTISAARLRPPGAATRRLRNIARRSRSSRTTPWRICGGGSRSAPPASATRPSSNTAAPSRPSRTTPSPITT